jgi:hypothetical protein
MNNKNRARNEDGSYRKKRSDTKVQTLKEDYPEFDSINGNTHLGTLKKQFNTDSLDGVLKALREQNQ